VIILILDATAGNRTMWQHKNTENIIYIDIEKRLHIKPTIFADNTKTPFLASSFDTIIYDPPHRWGGEVTYAPIYPGEIKRLKQKFKGQPFTYYGWDKYQTRLDFIRHLYYAQHEFKRILKDDGLLWMKWNEMYMKLRRVLSIFDNWTILMEILVSPKTHTYGKEDTYWVVMQKKVMVMKQAHLC